MHREQVLKAISDSGVIAIVRGISKNCLENVINALNEGGIICVEIASNSDDALSMVSFMAEKYADRVLTGVGTITDGKTAREFIKAGARFILSPSLHRDVIDAARENGVVSIPGAYTPTEIFNAYQWGGDIVKVFPSATGGVNYIKQIRAPFSHIPLLAVGGVTVENAADFVAAGCVGVGVGSNLVNPERISKGDFEWIKRTARMFKDAVENGRGL
ncbi:bifunctional 4-hydroxy-2-oxoglutarate aldolase/2-dehydro-3-deoxy-phosphogluconate aldolase [Caldanaerobius polysaccharolyticus]|uniref:bifunctional 4-hydroxy-2-oxoglutarate aldolase/2-dehydro-3-deoxy-phosphogluconate aldolase n=1 Tax=Caldanaerobius polysaccharolyticus TaxID=44256 RepID=UPI000478763C|nr:bifunctional 4-hydroxy-2-oxoglutarate aldolase/2-dehydro-3-deoxy-phosphogluconate aldolase [Caldanaerobius polysaccharolyticus]